jgi:hypothetical protein
MAGFQMTPEDGRRERTWSEHEIKVILGQLFAPKRDDEQVQSAIARYRVAARSNSVS